MKRTVLAILDSTDIYGKERANIHVYNILKENGVNVSVLYNKLSSINLKNEIVAFDSKAVSFPRGLKGKKNPILNIPYWIKANLSLRRHIEKLSPDYILIPTEIALFYLFIPLYFSKSKIVFRMGDDPIALRFKNKKYVGIYEFIWRNMILKRVDKIVCNALYIRDNLIKSGRNPSSQDTIIYNYPPERKSIAGNEDKLLLKQHSSFDGLKIGYIGRLVEEKGVSLLIETVSKLLDEGHNIKLLIAGNLKYDASYSQILIDYANKQSYTSNIIFLGEIKDSESFYKSIDLLCIPSIYNEPSANVVVEAKALGKPSLLFNVGGTPELIRHKIDGYICEDISVESLAKAITYYLEKPQALIEQAQAASESIEDLKIDKAAFEKRWLAIFQ